LDGTVTRTVSGDVGISEDGGSASERNGTSTTTETWTRKRVGRELEMAWEVLVVVDWNWDHMNPDTPFVPETFTPGWLK
jgi:hypothetical protein